MKLDSSIVEANPQLRKGGTTQYFIEDFNHKFKSMGDPIMLERRDLTLKGCNKKNKAMLQVDKIKVCNPLESLLNILLEKGFVIIKSKVSDFHFLELYIKLQGKETDELEQINIDKIKNIDHKNFSCACHWSIVELELVKD